MASISCWPTHQPECVNQRAHFFSKIKTNNCICLCFLTKLIEMSKISDGREHCKTLNVFWIIFEVICDTSITHTHTHTHTHTFALSNSYEKIIYRRKGKCTNWKSNENESLKRPQYTKLKSMKKRMISFFFNTVQHVHVKIGYPD